MGIGVVIHGYIECPGYAWQAEDKRIYRANRRVILGLPVSDPEYPFITRDMFSVLPLRPTLERRVAQYENHVIHFAGDYKNMYALDADWIRKFEAILSRLCWNRAVVTLDFSSFRYEWTVTDWNQKFAYRSNPPRPPTHWSFKCYRTELRPLAAGEAVNGTLASPHHVAATGAG